MFTCKHCGKEHEILRTLSPECLAAYEPATKEAIRAALDKGRKHREAFESYHPAFPSLWPRF